MLFLRWTWLLSEDTLYPITRTPTLWLRNTHPEDSFCWAFLVIRFPSSSKILLLFPRHRILCIRMIHLKMFWFSYSSTIKNPETMVFIQTYWRSEPPCRWDSELLEVCETRWWICAQLSALRQGKVKEPRCVQSLMNFFHLVAGCQWSQHSSRVSISQSKLSTSQ